MSTPDEAQSLPQSSRLTRLDRAVIAFASVIVGTILLGDHVGVEIVQVAPVAKAHSTSPIAIHIKEPGH